MTQDNQNYRGPNFESGVPLYPQVCQFVKVTGPTIGLNVYPCATQQSVGNSPSSTDKETAWVWEPNGNILVANKLYECRLIGTYNSGYPLYETSIQTTTPPPQFAYARVVLHSLPAYTVGTFQLIASANGALNPVECSANSVTLVTGDKILFCQEYTADVHYGVYVLTQGTVSTPWTLTLDTTVVETAGLKVNVGPEGLYNYSTVWNLETPNPITAWTTAVTFNRIDREVKFVKIQAVIGANQYSALLLTDDATNNEVTNGRVYVEDINTVFQPGGAGSLAIGRVYAARRGPDTNMARASNGYFGTFYTDQPPATVTQITVTECINGLLYATPTNISYAQGQLLTSAAGPSKITGCCSCGGASSSSSGSSTNQWYCYFVGQVTNCVQSSNWNGMTPSGGPYPSQVICTEECKAWYCLEFFTQGCSPTTTPCIEGCYYISYPELLEFIANGASLISGPSALETNCTGNCDHNWFCAIPPGGSTQQCQWWTVNQYNTNLAAGWTVLGQYDTYADCTAQCSAPPIQTTCCSPPIPQVLSFRIQSTSCGINTATSLNYQGTGLTDACIGATLYLWTGTVTINNRAWIVAFACAVNGGLVWACCVYPANGSGDGFYIDSGYIGSPGYGGFVNCGPPISVQLTSTVVDQGNFDVCPNVANDVTYTIHA